MKSKHIENITRVGTPADQELYVDMFTQTTHSSMTELKALHHRQNKLLHFLKSIL